MTTAELTDTDHLRRVFGAFPTGVTAVAAVVDGKPLGITANSFTSVSLDPPLVSLCLRRTSRTWARLRSAQRLGVSILSGEQEHASRQLASSNTDRFAGLQWRETSEGAVLLHDSAAWLVTSVVRHITAGDHDIVVLAVHDLDIDPLMSPLLFHASQFRTLSR